MSLSFGWENYLSPHQRSAPSDFEVHRAQMRHYDAWTSEHGRPGSLGAMDRAIAESQRSGGSSGSGGSSSGAHAGAVASKPKPSGGHVVVSGPDAGHSGDTEMLNPVLEPDITRAKFGINWEPNPYFSDVETGAEQRYGDVGGAVVGIGVALSDLVYNGWRFGVQQFERAEPIRRDIEAERERLIEENFFDPFEPITFNTGHGF